MGSLWDHLWHMKVTFGAFRDHFDLTLSISTLNFMCDACVMHTCTGLVGPNRGTVKTLLVFSDFLKGWCMRVTLGALRAHFWQTRATLGVLWCYFVMTSGMRGWLWGNFGATFGIWGCMWGPFGVTLGSLWSHLGVALGIFEWFCVTLRALWDYCGVTLGLWRSNFRKHFSPISFIDFIKLWS